MDTLRKLVHAAVIAFFVGLVSFFIVLNNFVVEVTWPAALLVSIIISLLVLLRLTWDLK